MRPAPRVALATLAALCTLAMVLALISPWLAERLLFLPDRSDPGPAPVVAGVVGEDLTLRTDDGVDLHAWWWEASPGAPAVLLLHGNAGHIGYRVPLAEGFVERGVSVLLPDYRGYGRSGGRPTEAGIHLDARAALAFAIERTGDPRRVVPFGRSMGGAPAARLAADEPVGGLILEAAFTSLDAVGAAVYPFLPGFLLTRIRGRFDTLGTVGRVEVPVLVVHGTRDGIVPVEMGRALAEAAGPNAEWYAVEGADHNDAFIVGGAAYFDRLAGFVGRATASQ